MNVMRMYILSVFCFFDWMFKSLFTPFLHHLFWISHHMSPRINFESFQRAWCMITREFLTDRDLQKKENAKCYFRNEILFHASAPVSLGEQMPDGGVLPVYTPLSEIFIRFWHSPIGGETKGALCPSHLVLYTNLSFDVELFQLFISPPNH